MGMGMSMGQSLSQQLNLRQAMEQRVEMAMKIGQRMVLELSLYSRREEVFKQLYAQSLERGDVRVYRGHGLNFEYARLKREELPQSLIDERSCGFAHCLYNVWDTMVFGRKIALAKGTWLLFTVPDFFSPLLFPDCYVEYVAVHEHGEEVTLGEHHLATKLEFAISQRDRKIAPYVQWLENHYPEKFSDVFSNQTRVILPDSQEFQQMLELKAKEEYAVNVRRMVEGFEWPFKILQKLSLYEHKGREAEALALRMCVVVGDIAKSLSGDLPIPDAMAKLSAAMRMYLLKVKDQRRFICWPRINPSYRDARGRLADGFAIYRQKRSDALNEQFGPQGANVFVEEIGQLQGGGNLPTTGIFSPRLEEAITAL